MNIAFTSVELINPDRGGKIYQRLEDGTLDKQTIGWMNEGTASCKTVPDMRGFADVLVELPAGREILIYGTPKTEIGEEGIRLVSRKMLGEGEIARTNEEFQWTKGPAIFPIGYDPVGETLSKESLWACLTDVVPELANHDVVWGCSVSSYVYDLATGKELVGLKGQNLWGNKTPARLGVLYYAAENGFEETVKPIQMMDLKGDTQWRFKGKHFDDLPEGIEAMLDLISSEVLANEISNV